MGPSLQEPQPMEQTVSPAQQHQALKPCWLNNQRGAQVGGRRHTEEDKVAQKHGMGYVGESTGWATPALTVASLATVPWLAQPPPTTFPNHWANLPPRLLKPRATAVPVADAEVENLARPDSVNQLGLHGHGGSPWASPPPGGGAHTLSRVVS